MTNHQYADQMQQAKQVADALLKVSADKRFVFALIVESMIIGAEIAESQMTTSS
ncbi:MAG: hypothetical protein HFG18_05880 [Oscillospiraceae bacterium]|nr:hypothetical protein [Oscillospiraceae bacterium]